MLETISKQIKLFAFSLILIVFNSCGIISKARYGNGFSVHFENNWFGKSSNFNENRNTKSKQKDSLNPTLKDIAVLPQSKVNLTLHMDTDTFELNPVELRNSKLEIQPENVPQNEIKKQTLTNHSRIIDRDTKNITSIVYFVLSWGLFIYGFTFF
jgi:hypothetical protein